MRRKASKPQSDSRARDDSKHPHLVGVQERVKYIMGLMADGRWRTGVHHAELSEHWGVSHSAIMNYTSEASRWLGEMFGDEDELRTRLMATLEAISLEARICDSKASVMATRTLAEIGGIIVKRVAHEYDKMSDAQAAAKMEETVAKNLDYFAALVDRLRAERAVTVIVDEPKRLAKGKDM